MTTAQVVLDEIRGRLLAGAGEATRKAETYMRRRSKRQGERNSNSMSMMARAIVKLTTIRKSVL